MCSGGGFWIGYFWFFAVFTLSRAINAMLTVVNSALNRL